MSYSIYTVHIIYIKYHDIILGLIKRILQTQNKMKLNHIMQYYVFVKYYLLNDIILYRILKDGTLNYIILQITNIIYYILQYMRYIMYRYMHILCIVNIYAILSHNTIIIIRTYINHTKYTLPEKHLR